LFSDGTCQFVYWKRKISVLVYVGMGGYNIASRLNCVADFVDFVILSIWYCNNICQIEN